MNRWRLTKDWALVWGLTFLLVSLILYIGYRSSISEISTEGPQGINNESVYPVSASSSSNPGDSLSKEVSQYPVQEPGNSLAQDGQFKHDVQLVLGQTKGSRESLELEDFSSPVTAKPLRSNGNYYSEAIGAYIFHAGEDYALSEGTVIRATRRGKVVAAGADVFLGQKVTLDCGEGWLVTYGGLDNLRVQEGEIVETQNAIGQVGLYPGAEEENHQTLLHYEVWHDGRVQNP